MEIITEILIDDLFKIMQSQKGNTKTFCEDLENNYNYFKKCIEFLINYGFDITYLLNDIHIRSVFILDLESKNELSENDFKFYKIDNNKYLAIEY